MTSKNGVKYKYRLQFVPSSLADWKTLDESVKETFRKLIKKRLENPYVPGSELHGALNGCYKIKLRKLGFRLVYMIEDDALIVMVLAVDRRQDNVVYQSAMERLTNLVSALERDSRLKH